MISIKGKCGITATVIQDSISPQKKRIITFELDYPRFIHAELMTHRLFSRNAASSRAIPVDKMHKHIYDTPAIPVHWGKNQPGMSAKEALEGDDLEKAKMGWAAALRTAIEGSKTLLAAGLHKQIANRPTEAFQMMKTIVTSTEWDNWFWLRFHADAQPEIHELARVMMDAQLESIPMPIKHNEWHVPYVNRHRDNSGHLAYSDGGTGYLTLHEARQVSASCCAQVSYRKLDDSIEKAKDIFNKLIYSEPMHASPIEHQAMPMLEDEAVFNMNPKVWEPGITHMNNKRKFGSGNFYGWIQFRQLIPNSCK